MSLLMNPLKIIFFFFNDTATTEIYPFSLHDALPISAHKQQIQMLFESGQGPAYRGSRELEMGRRSAERSRLRCGDEYSDAIEIGRFAHVQAGCAVDRKSTRLNSSHSQISYAVFCLKK